MMDATAWLATRKGLFRIGADAACADAIAASHFVGDPVSAVAFSADGTIGYAALHLGHFGCKVHRSADAGRSWSEVATPAYPLKPAERDDPSEWKLQQIWTLEVEADGGRVWAGTLPGGLFFSDDQGASWQLVTSLWDRAERLEWFGGGYDVAGVHSVCVHPHDPARITVGISCGGVWLSADRGLTWSLGGYGMQARYMPEERSDDRNIQDPHRIARCAGAPETIWCQHHNGIFLSRDAGHSWREIVDVPVSGFGFAVAAHPRDPDCAWFFPARSDQCRIPVDARLCALRTRDGGQSFEVCRDGLDGRPSFDLVYRHALAAEPTRGDLLAGSTTGHAWISTDEGAHWARIGADFPPVYAVAWQASR